MKNSNADAKTHKDKTIDAIQHAWRILTWANLQDINPYLYGVAQELSGFKEAIMACEYRNHTSASQAIMGSVGFVDLTGKLEFIFSKFIEDKALTRQLCDRIIKTHKLPISANELAAEFDKTNSLLQSAGARGKTGDELPDLQKKAVLESLQGLKGKLAIGRKP